MQCAHACPVAGSAVAFDPAVVAHAPDIFPLVQRSGHAPKLLAPWVVMNRSRVVPHAFQRGDVTPQWQLTGLLNPKGNARDAIGPSEPQVRLVRRRPAEKVLQPAPNEADQDNTEAVSYTHLTLPTILLV